MTNGIAFLKELTAKLDKRPELALLWSLLWMFMMLSLKFDGMFFVVLLLILFFGSGFDNGIFIRRRQT